MIADILRYFGGCVPRPNSGDARALAERAARGFSRSSVLRLAEARAVAEAHPGRAWEALALAGLVPDSWLGDPARGFVNREDIGMLGVVRRHESGRYRVLILDGSGWDVVGAKLLGGADHGDLVALGESTESGRHTYFPVLEPEPSDDLAVALAADVVNVELAERLARELASRLEPWGAEPVRRVGWEIYDDAGRPEFDLRSALATALKSAEQASTWRERNEDSRLSEKLIPQYIERDGESWYNPSGIVRLVIDGHFYWRRLSAAGARIRSFSPETTSTPPPPGSLRDVRYADLLDPFAPLLELAALGYWSNGPEGADLRIFARRPTA